MDFLNKLDIKLLVFFMYGGKELNLKDLPELVKLAKRLNACSLSDAIGVEVLDDGAYRAVPVSEALDRGFKDSYPEVSNPPKLSMLGKGKGKVDKFLKMYLKEFENETLLNKDNFYSYQEHIRQLQKEWGSVFDSCGRQFSVPDSGLGGSRNRPWELALILQEKKCLKIVGCSCEAATGLFDGLDDDSVEGGLRFSLTVSMIKSPSEIRDFVGYWDVYYGDIRINTKNGVAFYKSNRYSAPSSKGLAFRLLVHLVRHAGKPQPIDKLFDQIDDSDPKHELGLKTRKKRIEDWMKEIRKNIGLAADKSPTITITTEGNSALLISNPPQ